MYSLVRLKHLFHLQKMLKMKQQNQLAHQDRKVEGEVRLLIIKRALVLFQDATHSSTLLSQLAILNAR